MQFRHGEAANAEQRIAGPPSNASPRTAASAGRRSEGFAGGTGDSAAGHSNRHPPHQHHPSISASSPATNATGANSNGHAAADSSTAAREQILRALSHLDDTRAVLRRYNFFHETEKTGPSRGRKSMLKLSCVACRDTKVKCITEKEGVGPCTRCQKQGKECVFEKHRRTQKRDAE